MADKSETALRSYFQQGDIWEQEIIKRAKRSARVAWFFSIVFAGIALLSLLAVVLMLPLKSFEPYVELTQFGGVEMAADGRIWIGDRGDSFDAEAPSGLLFAASLDDEPTRTNEELQVRCVEHRQDPERLFVCQPFEAGWLGVDGTGYEKSFDFREVDEFFAFHMDVLRTVHANMVACSKSRDGNNRYISVEGALELLLAVLNVGRKLVRVLVHKGLAREAVTFEAHMQVEPRSSQAAWV